MGKKSGTKNSERRAAARARVCVFVCVLLIRFGLEQGIIVIFVLLLSIDTGIMLESKKPSQFIKKLQSNEVELSVHFLDETTHKFSVKVSTMLLGVCFFLSPSSRTKSIYCVFILNR